MSAFTDAVAALSATLIAHYRMNETSGSTLNDSSGAGHHGTIEGSPNYAVTGLLVGDSDKAMNFDNAFTSARVADAAWMDTNNASLFVIHKATGGNNKGITSRFNGSDSAFLIWYNTSGKIACRFYNAAGSQVDLEWSTTPTTGTTYRIVPTYDGTTARLYINGTQVASSTAISGNLRASSAELMIGGYQGSFRSQGTYDEVLWFSSALSAAQVQALEDGATGTVASGSLSLAGTVQASTAAFTVATVLATSLAGTVQPSTALFDLSASAQVSLAGTTQTPTGEFQAEVSDAQVDVALVGVAPRPTGVFEALTGASVALAGETQSPVAGFALLAAAQVSLAGTTQAATAEFVISTADRSVSLAGSAQRATAAIALTGQPVIRLAGTARPATGLFTADARPSVALAGTVQPSIATFTTYVVTPPTSVPPALRQHGPAPVVIARALGPVTMHGTQPVYSVSSAAIQRARQQILVDGVDVTFLRDVRTPDVTWTLLAPLRYGPGQLDLPQIAAAHEELGEDREPELQWLRTEAPVEVNLVIDDPAGIEPPQVVMQGVYKGVVVAFDLDGDDLSLELGGQAGGRAHLRNRQDVLFPRVNDIGHQISDAVRDLGLPVFPALGTVTGIEVMTTGGVGHIEHIQNLCAQAWTRQGKYWTVMPNAHGVYEVRQKSDTVIHGTVFFDDARTVAKLRRDIAEEPNRIFITGVTPQGQRVRFGVYPNLRQGPVPPFPGHMESGDTGEGVRLLIGKLHAVGYLKLVEVSGGYDFDVVEAVKDLQADAGLPKTGEVNEATWNALYDLNVTTTSLEGAHIEPAAQDPRVQRYHRSGSGTILEFSDDYDHEALPVDRNIDAGVGKTRSQLREFANTVLEAASTPNWVGDITFHTGALLRDEQAADVTVTPEIVMDARELIPTMNLLAPRFNGGTQFNISACQVDESGIVTATVDTRLRDAAEVWEIIDRNRESRNDPARRRNQKHRSSTIPKDSIGTWDEIGGLLGHDVQLDAGWNVFEVVAAMEGTIARFRLALGTPAEFACAVFGREVDRGFMADVIGLPLTANGKRNWRRPTPRARLRDRWMNVSFGTPEEPCGYGEDLKSDGAALTGVMDEYDFGYFSEDRTKLYVAVWVGAENTIPLGRIMWPRLEAGA